MPYLTTEQWSMLCNALGLCFFGISAMILITMRSKRYLRMVTKKTLRKTAVNFNRELSLAVTGMESWKNGLCDEQKRFQERKKTAGEKRLRTNYDTARRLAEKGLNVEGIREKVNLPRNEIELIVKFKRMNMASPGRNERKRHGDFGNGRLEALRIASEKFASNGSRG